jgi:hypothetical protein
MSALIFSLFKQTPIQKKQNDCGCDRGWWLFKSLLFVAVSIGHVSCAGLVCAEYQR